VHVPAFATEPARAAMTSTLTSYQMIAGNLQRWQSLTKAQPDVANATAYYQKAIGGIKTIDGFLNNYRVFSYAIKAFGLDDLIYAKGLMRKVLQGGVADSKSYANKLSDPRFRAFAAAFDFAGKGAAATATAAATTDVVNAYVQQTTEANAGAQNEGVRLALYFQRKAAAIVSPYQILADKALLRVVQTALQIPPESSAQDIDKQAQTIVAKLNLKDLQDPAKVTKFIQKFAVLYDLNNASLQPPAPAVQLIGGDAASSGMSADLWMSLQTLAAKR
jgi:hypothetical protein